ncbi:alkaline phosphatase-like [Pieris brassicae]|uniref:alkaline phosphatase-like n=1 Tax=Pieris brassicae TaxID=7116 RepID=UPI001E661B60|nr:alkaline phosphatase-like [Pieris brassicae]
MFARGVVVLLVFIISAQCVLRKDRQYWEELGENEIEEALNIKNNLGVAKNVILFIGDGMGAQTVTAARIHKGGEGHRLSFEKFPHMGVLKTYSADKMVPDSASTATALLGGVKTNDKTLGVDASVPNRDCEASLRPEAKVESLAAHALRAGKAAGFVTTMRVTHATPAPVYAFSSDRNWECDALTPANCKDIARQLIEDWPGRDLNVILGGGRQSLITNATALENDPLSDWACYRKDGRNLIEDYKKDKESRGLNYTFVGNTEQLKSIPEDTDYLLGIFSNAHLPFEFQRRPESPSIVDMTEAAIKVLQRNRNGFFLMVEGGNIDMGHHRGRARTAIDEALAMEEAVKLAYNMTDPSDTLIVVTSDHAHSMTINGHPNRGDDIFGTVGPSRVDGLNYTTIAYGTGGPGSRQYEIQVVNGTNQIVRRDPTQDDTTDFMYEQIAAITLEENKHGGGDVGVYASGPYSHLFHNVHEQHYVYYAISYAARLGKYAERPTDSGAFSIQTNLLLSLMSLLLVLIAVI